VKNIFLISAAIATLVVGSNFVSAQVKTEEGGKGVSEPSDKGDLGRTDPKEEAAPSAKEPKGGVQVRGQPEPKAPDKPSYGYK
jgi:hypothetical protein